MLVTGHQRRLSLSSTKEQIPLNCEFSLDNVSSFDISSFISLSDLTDADFFLEDFNSTLFPGLPSGIQGHNGFLAEQAITAEEILSEVQSLLSQYDSSLVYTVSSSFHA
jgi:hypothetical protein